MRIRYSRSFALLAWLLMGSATAFAAKGGVVYVHGTGDYPGTQSCSGTGNSFKCIVQNAIDNYWTQEFVDSTRKRSDETSRPYAVVGCKLGSRTPWYNATPVKNDAGASGAESGEASACVGPQIERFIKGPDNVYGNADDITDIVVVAHSGGGNHIRYILEQYTASTTFTRVKNASKKVVALTAPFRGTYLANWVFTGGSLGKFVNNVLEFMGGNGLYNDDGTYFVRTNAMDSHNTDSSKYVGMNNPVSGVTFRSGYGTYPDAAAWDGKTYCGGYSYQAGLNLLHRLYLSQNDAATYRDGCSDGFLTCLSTGALGQVFRSGRFLSHHQTRRTKSGCSCSWWASSSCYNTTSAWDISVRGEVNSTAMAYTDVPTSGDASDVPHAKWDACGFATPGWVSYSDYGRTSFYTPGCPQSYLGDGYCDWDCFASYGRDAVPTWENNDPSTNRVVSWGADDCTFGSSRSAFSSSFSGDVNGDGYTDYSEYNDTSYCPDSWLNDGACDECWLAKAGSDGNDCRAGMITSCYGLGTNGGSTIYREIGFLPPAASCGNGMCEANECTGCASDCPGLCN
ncbi:MAG: hypothetical protein HY698_14375 [Deltaproteobacteria bacterium]|nr:hypothetical protein [Deltaproteobacteria bacterium]